MASWRFCEQRYADWVEKICSVLGLIPAMIQGRSTLKRWTTPSGCASRAFLNGPTAILLPSVAELIGPKFPATILLTALNRFLQEKNGSKMAFLDGPGQSGCVNWIVDYISDRGGEVAECAAEGDRST